MKLLVYSYLPKNPSTGSLSYQANGVDIFRVGTREVCKQQFAPIPTDQLSDQNFVHSQLGIQAEEENACWWL